jgi:hypothetical protein
MHPPDTTERIGQLLLGTARRGMENNAVARLR